MPDHFEQVREFHKQFGLTVQTTLGFPDSKTRDFRKNLLQEEWHEYLRGEEQNDIVNVAQELVDMLYIIYGTAVSYGIPLNDVFAEVHRANMSKTPAPNGEKPLKEEGYIPADVQRVLKNANTSHDKSMI